MAERNIALAFPEMDEVQQDGLVRETLQETGSLAAEMGHVWLRPWSRTAALINRVEGEGSVKAALSRGRGVIVLGPHLGNWEVLGLHLATLGEMVALYEPPKLASLGPMIKQARERSGGLLVPTTPRGIASLASRRGEFPAFFLTRFPMLQRVGLTCLSWGLSAAPQPLVVT